MSTAAERTSVEYMSQTSPIPCDKNDIAVATALAGEMLGMKAIYLEGGSGAARPVDPADDQCGEGRDNHPAYHRRGTGFR
ncbi:MAG: hypothetical protein MZV63_54415 [Marinilabiliales bacterium]|nr:hypothetical protein [Marinilabiliales bacterium]